MLKRKVDQDDATSKLESKLIRDQIKAKQTNKQTETIRTQRTVEHHLVVLLLRGTFARLTPVDVISLTTVQPDQLIYRIAKLALK